MADLTQGLIISIAGLLVTFSFFGILIVLIELLKMVYRAAPRERLTKPEWVVDLVIGETRSLEDDRMKAAGIAAAVARLRARGQAGDGLGRSLEYPPGRWWDLARREYSE